MIFRSNSGKLNNKKSWLLQSQDFLLTFVTTHYSTQITFNATLILVMSRHETFLKSCQIFLHASKKALSRSVVA